MVSKPTDKNACNESDYVNANHRPASDFYPKGTSPGLGKEYGNKNDGDLTNGFSPQVRKN